MSRIENIEDWPIINHSLLTAELLAEIKYEDFIKSHGIENIWTLEAKMELDRAVKAREIFKKY